VPKLPSPCLALVGLVRSRGRVAAGRLHNPADEGPVAAVEDDGDPPDAAVRETARVVGQGVAVAPGIQDRGPKRRQPRRTCGTRLQQGAVVVVAAGFTAMPVFLERP
jgi:hypothetical protein